MKTKKDNKCKYCSDIDRPFAVTDEVRYYKKHDGTYTLYVPYGKGDICFHYLKRCQWCGRKLKKIHS